MEEDIRNNWKNTNFQSLTGQQIENIIDGRRRTGLENLAQRYKRFSVISFIFVFWSVMMFFSDLFPKNSKPLLPILFGLYFFIASSIDYWLYQGISGIDCATMNVAEVIRLAYFYRKRHLQSIILLLPYAITIVGLMIYYYNDDVNNNFIYGVVCGALVGLAIGTRQFMKFMADYRKVTKDY